MINKKILIAVSAAMALGFLGTSLAQADSDREQEGFAFHTGPLGQPLGRPAAPEGAYAYGFAPPYGYELAPPVQAPHPATRHHHTR